MPQPSDRELIAVMLDNIRANHDEATKEKGELRRQNKGLQNNLNAVGQNVLSLSVECAKLKKDVQKYRDIGLLRKMGAFGIAVIGVASPFCMPYLETSRLCYTGFCAALFLSIGMSLYDLFIIRKQPDD